MKKSWSPIVRLLVRLSSGSYLFKSVPVQRPLVRLREWLDGLAAALCERFANGDAEAIMAARVQQWCRDDPARTRRFKYDLKPDDVVFDLGGYEGVWADGMARTHGCNVFVFEPVSEFYQNLQTRFRDSPKVRLFNFGLANANATKEIHIQGDGTSLFRESERKESIRLVHTRQFLEEHGIASIRVMKINIEGAEYDLLDYLIDAGLVHNIGSLLIQFHDFMLEADRRMAEIHRKLFRTHRLTYQYRYVFENWERLP